MNIFILDKDPYLAAISYCDKHIPKMVLELAQMLSTAHRVCGTDPWEGMYKTAFLNHPCTVWVRENKTNYLWAAKHFLALSDQYKMRFHRTHKCWDDHGRHLLAIPTSLLRGRLTPFAQAMPNEYKTACAVTAYRCYYKNEKKRFAKWERGVNPPLWWTEEKVND